MEQGRFITFEGGEGSGKSTQVRRLAEALRATGRDVVLTREPGGAPGAEEIRHLLVNGGVDRWDGVSEALLHFAARRDHLRATIWPAIERGAWVISDRFADSTLAYQGGGHGLSPDDLHQLYRITVGDFAPDLTLILDIPVEMGLSRAAARNDGEDRYERMDVAFHDRLRGAFKAIAANEPKRCAIIDASASIDAVAAAVRAETMRRLNVELG